MFISSELVIIYAVTFVAIVAIVGILSLTAIAIYLREVISVSGKAKVDTINGTAETEVIISDIKKEVIEDIEIDH